MNIRIVAVGQRITSWADIATRDYLARFPKDFSVDLKEIRTEPRAGQTPAKLMQAEANRIVEAILPGSIIVVLDEHGEEYSTMDFTKKIASWRTHSESVTFIIGGPDGLSPEIKSKANKLFRLSSMTLPHAMARVILAEQLYRAWSIMANHPYHRA